MTEYNVIVKRTLSQPYMIILFTGIMQACQHYVVHHAGPFEVVEVER